MTLSIEPQDGRSIEGIFVSQVEQRHVDHSTHLPHPRERRPSEGRDSSHLIDESTRSFGMGGTSSNQSPSTRRQATRSRWLEYSWIPWRQKPAQNYMIHRSSRHIPQQTPWFPQIWNRLPAATATAERIWRLLDKLLLATAAMVGSKRRKSWFMSIIMVSLIFTLLSGGYMLTQLHSSKDISLMSPDDPSGDSGDQIEVPFGRGATPSGPRRSRGKGNGANKDKAPASGKETLTGKDGQDGDHDSHQVPNTATSAEQETRICDVQDVSNGQWILKPGARHPFAVPAGGERDMTWTGYGRSGCPSNIWNERYLLTPAPSAIGQKQSKKDWNYATHLKAYYWQLHQPTQGNKSPKITDEGGICRQPSMDVVDFVEVLKRAPLVMIGDRFLEQEYLTLECMILGMQRQLVMDYPGEKFDTDGKDYPLSYRIESEKPEIVELQIAPAGSVEGSGMYRKARPGQMRLVDRLSNLTLATFIRSDVLWDSDMMQKQVSKHALKSTAELSKLEIGGLHPDCQIIGHVTLCEPANIHIHDMETEHPTPSSSWWNWWMGTDRPILEQTQDSMNDQDEEEEEMSHGSDLDHDMINLEWAEMLQEFLSVPLQEHKDKGSPRTPTVLISNGVFWEYDPRDAMTTSEFTQVQGSKRLSKSEQEHLQKRQVRRKKMLRQRYTMILTNMLDYLQDVHPGLRVMVQTSVKRRPCESPQQQNARKQGSVEAANKALQDSKDQEAALLNALTKTVVAKMQDERFSFLDTTFLRHFQDSTTNKKFCRNFMMPGPLDILVQHLYGELYRLDL